MNQDSGAKADQVPSTRNKGLEIGITTDEIFETFQKAQDNNDVIDPIMSPFKSKLGAFDE